MQAAGGAVLLYKEGTFDVEDFSMRSKDENVKIQQVYENKKILDLLQQAEIERENSEVKSPPNVFFGLKKRAFGMTISTVTLNLLVLAIYCLGAFVTLCIVLNQQLKRT